MLIGDELMMLMLMRVLLWWMYDHAPRAETDDETCMISMDGRVEEWCAMVTVMRIMLYVRKQLSYTRAKWECETTTETQWYTTQQIDKIMTVVVLYNLLLQLMFLIKKIKKYILFKN